MPDTLRAQQLAFAHHVRDPDAHPTPDGVEDHRLRVYRELFHANIATLLGGSFPVIRRALGEDAWRALVRAFYAGHRARTPLFTAVAREFVDWLAARDAGPADPPWLAELAHYEWVELDLQIAEDDQADDPAREFTLAPLVRPLAYAWPVHRIGPGHRPTTPPGSPTLLLARRDASGDVRFSELSALVFRLLQLLDDPVHRTGTEVLGHLADEAGRAADPAFLSDAAGMLGRLVDEGIARRRLC